VRSSKIFSSMLAVMAASVCTIAGSVSAVYATDSVTVAVTNSVDITVSAGASVSDGGDCTITNNSSTDTVTITELTYSVSNPNIFSSITMTVGGESETTSSPASSDSQTFDVSISPGSTVDCMLSAEISSSAGSGSSSTSRSAGSLYASVIPLNRSNCVIGMFAILVLWCFIPRGRRNVLYLGVLLVAIGLATTEVGCGNGSSSSSTQTITSIEATSSVGTDVSGLPATLGTITVD
jgi:hypothetical protein